MIHTRDLVTLFRSPQTLIGRLSQVQPSPRTVVVQIALPLALVKSGAVLLRASLSGNLRIGIVLSISSLVLSLSAYAATATAMPMLGRQVGVAVTTAQAYLLSAIALIPTWLAGALFVVSEDPALLWVWSRGTAVLISGYGLYLLYAGLKEMGVAAAERLTLTTLVTVLYLAIFAALFLLFGISSHVLLFMLGAS